jgi:hypothetical protein
MEKTMKQETPKSDREAISLSALRPGQWIRLVAIALSLLALIFFLVMPQILIAYQKYSNTASAGARDYVFSPELISGLLNLTGNGYFSYYQISTLGPEVLVAQKGSFNTFALINILIGLIACGMDGWLTFTKKNEKWAKLCGLLFVISGLMCFMGPIFFLAVNRFGEGNSAGVAQYFDYWMFDSLYVHDAYGAIVSGLTYFAAAIAFGVGTGLEGGNKNDNRQQED